MMTVPISPPHHAHQGAANVSGRPNDPNRTPGTASTSRVAVPVAKFSQVVVIGLRAATVTRPLMPCWTVAAAPTTAARIAGTTTAAVLPDTRPPTATTTPTMARRAAATRATVTGTRPAGPIPSLSTPTAVRV